MPIVVAHDAIHANISHLPAGQAAGYTTGSTDIRWTSADWKAHPGAVRIDQDFSASDFTADVLDVERGAATNAESPNWYKKALANFTSAARPGQRHPSFYCSASNVTPLVNALIAGGVKTGPGLWVANWNLSNAEAIAAVTSAAGPFPVIGIQFSSGAFYDTNVFSTAWLGAVSHTKPPVPTGDGPFRHVAKWWQTQAGIAKARGTTVQQLAEISAGAYTEQDAAIAASKRLRPGMPYYTKNP